MDRETNKLIRLRMLKMDNYIMFGVFTIISFMFLCISPVIGAIGGCYYITLCVGVVGFFLLFSLTAYPYTQKANKIHEQIEREFGVIEENFDFREVKK